MTYPIGTHLKVSRAGGLYTHHGIYVGNGEVIHYAGFCEIFKYEPVGQVSLAEFQREATHIDIISHHNNCIYTPEEIVCRAKSRLHENKYSLLRNNCEHFVSWCITGKAISKQVRVAMSALSGLLCILPAIIFMLI